MTLQASGNFVSVGLGLSPCEGAETVFVPLDFTGTTIIDLDFSFLQSVGKWGSLQSIYINNSQNGASIQLDLNTTQQSILLAAGKSAYFPLISNNPPKIKFTSAGATIVPVNLMNFYIPPCVW